MWQISLSGQFETYLGHWILNNTHWKVGKGCMSKICFLLFDPIPVMRASLTLEGLGKTIGFVITTTVSFSYRYWTYVSIFRDLLVCVRFSLLFKTLYFARFCLNKKEKLWFIHLTSYADRIIKNGICVTICSVLYTKLSVCFEFNSSI